MVVIMKFFFGYPCDPVTTFVTVSSYVVMFFVFTRLEFIEHRL